MENAFLNSNIWSVPQTNQPYLHEQFYLVHQVYHYNSLYSGMINFDIDCLQLPEFEIQNIELLQNLDFDFINKNQIPILCRDNEVWKIDLKYYEHYKLQRNNIQTV